MGRRPLKGRATTNTTPDEPESSAIVAFDFDGTITARDSYTAFLRWRAGGWRYFVGMVRLAPAALSYLFHRDRGRIKAEATKEYLSGVPRETLEEETLAFAREMAQGLLRQDAVSTFRWWRERGATVVIVTASPDVVVAPFARALGAHALLGTQLEYDANDRVTGAFACLNCRGDEKVNRLKAHFGEDVRLAAAYGDTSGDHAMLKIAEEKGYRVFKSKP
ncbi:MAG TPA: HAD-IB family hydrolase [Caulobacteraceae bacterium]